MTDEWKRSLQWGREFIENIKLAGHYFFHPIPKTIEISGWDSTIEFRDCKFEYDQSKLTPISGIGCDSHAQGAVWVAPRTFISTEGKGDTVSKYEHLGEPNFKHGDFVDAYGNQIDTHKNGAQ